MTSFLEIARVSDEPDKLAEQSLVHGDARTGNNHGTQADGSSSGEGSDRHRSAEASSINSPDGPRVNGPQAGNLDVSAEESEVPSVIAEYALDSEPSRPADAEVPSDSELRGETPGAGGVAGEQAAEEKDDDGPSETGELVGRTSGEDESAESEDESEGGVEVSVSAAPADEFDESELAALDETPESGATTDEPPKKEATRPGTPVYLAESESDEPLQMDWYILKVQSNRERSITDALKRKIAVEGIDRYFGHIIVPTEKVTEFKGGKKRIVERKLWPGYIVVQMHINDDTWFAVRETSGIGDFTGAAGKPTPMQAHEVARIVQSEEEVADESPKLDIKFSVGDRVKVKEGNFESFEGEVSSIDEASGRVTVMINIFGRSTPVELEYWQIESL